jgi:hypothetical protein
MPALLSRAGAQPAFPSPMDAAGRAVMDRSKFLCVAKIEVILSSAPRNFGELGHTAVVECPFGVSSRHGRWPTKCRLRAMTKRPPTETALLLVQFDLKGEFRLEHRTARVADFDCHLMTQDGFCFRP